jgi:Ca-activated chloride channel family protein
VIVHNTLTNALMHFIWPHFLWCFSLALALPLIYLWLLKRKRRFAYTYPSLNIIRQALGANNGWRRHTPPALLWLALCASIIGAARPTAEVTLPADYMTLVLAVDVSRSMLAEDVEPNRIRAAQATVKEFLSELPHDIRVGIVSFAGTAQVVQQVTDEREALVASIDRFQLQRGTATGSGLLLALSTLLPNSGVDLQAAIYGEEFGRWGGAPLANRKPSAPTTLAPPPVPPGSYTNGAIILLSDGRRTNGPDPLAAAKQAAQRGVRVYTVAFGTPNGFIPGWEGSSFYARVDEQALQAIAKITEGEFFRAGNSQDLKEVYRHLSSKFSLERRDTEISALFGALSLTLTMLALCLSLVWFKRSSGER